MHAAVKDPGHVILRRAARVAIVVPLCYLVVRYAMDMPIGAPYAVFGSIVLLGFADFGGPTPDRARAYIVTSLVGIAVIILGTFASATIWSAVLVMFALGVVVSYSAVLRGYVAAAGTSVLLPFAIAVTSPMVISEIPQRCIGFAVAAAIATLSALLMWPAHQRSALRNNVADALVAAAIEMNDRWDPTVDATKGAFDRIEALNVKVRAVHTAYDGVLTRPGSGTKRDRSMIQLIEELNRLVTAFGWRPTHERHARPCDVRLVTRAKEVLDESAAALKGSGVAPDGACLNEAREEHLVASEAWAGQMVQAGKANEAHVELDDTFQLRLVATFAQFIGFFTRGAVGAPSDASQIGTMSGHQLPLPTGSRTPMALLRSQLTLRSPWLRNAIRAGLALSLAVLIAQVLDLQHAFWVVLGALTALRFDAMGTGRTAIQAITGTVAGFLVGTAVIMMVGDMPVVLWILFPVLCFLAAYTPGAISLTVGQAAFTVLVITLYGLIAPAGVATGEIRVIDVGLGLAVSLVVSALLWPRGIASSVCDSLQASVVASTAFLMAAVRQIVQGPDVTPEVTRAAAAAINSVDLAHETFDLALASRVPEGLSADTWARLSNVAGHVVQCADYIVFMAESGRRIESDAVNEQLLLACSHVHDHLNAAIAKLSNLRADSTAIDAPPIGNELRAQGVADLDQSVNDYLATLATDSKSTAGAQALTAIWLEQWLAHIDWLATRVEAALVAAGGHGSPVTATIQST